MARGQLRIYLGAAPGVGKTYAMLNEGRRRHDRGTDVVVGYVETHGRPRTTEQIGDLEVVPRRVLEYRGATFEEMDVDAILARRPAQVLVDELAHTNVPGSRNEKRWQDVEELLDAGINVISTVNIQHLESVNDVVERITGVEQRERIPDEVVRRADALELVDMSPEALRRRMAHGNIYKPEKIDAALGHYFRPGNLSALRELALLWVADQVDDSLEAYRERHGITQPWETRERVLVAITGAPGTESLVRRAARIAQRAHGELLGLHVQSDEGLAGPRAELIDRHKQLLVELGGEYHEVAAGDVAAAMTEFARAENCTQLVLGASRRSRWSELFRGSVINRAIRLSGTIDVHVISHDPTEEELALPRDQVRRRSEISPRRRALAWIFAGVALPLLTFVLANARDDFRLPSVLLLYLLVTVVTAAIGGMFPALVVAVAGFLCANYFFTPPIHTWTISDHENLLALVVFVAVAAVVSWFVDTSARRAADTRRARAEAETLARLVASAGRENALYALVDHVRSAFALDGAALLCETESGWHVEAASGTNAPTEPEGATHVAAIGDGVVLALNGPGLNAEDYRVLNAFTAHLAAAHEHDRLSAAAATAMELGQANELRAALLQAVSHDLRTPLAAIKASASSLRQPDVQWSPEDERDFLETIETETDRLTGIVTNLLDMSRIQAGAVDLHYEVFGVDEVVSAAVSGLRHSEHGISLDVPESLPPVRGDAALFERVVANVIENAVKWSPPDAPVRVYAGTVHDQVHLRIEDRGPGIPTADRERVFQPFQRVGDGRTGVPGVGLGLAVARGFMRAMDGDLFLEDTPGGGTTAVLVLPRDT